MYSLPSEEHICVDYENEGSQKKKRTFSAKNVDNIPSEQESSENRNAKRRRNDNDTEQESGSDEIRKITRSFGY